MFVYGIVSIYSVVPPKSISMEAAESPAPYSHYKAQNFNGLYRYRSITSSNCESSHFTIHLTLRTLSVLFVASVCPADLKLAPLKDLKLLVLKKNKKHTLKILRVIWIIIMLWCVLFFFIHISSFMIVQESHKVSSNLLHLPHWTF